MDPTRNGVIAVMLVIIGIGMLVEFGFAAADRRVRRRGGLLVPA
jgi:ABC-type nitrate/sulfonate/bicarbonate transport system permease component